MTKKLVIFDLDDTLIDNIGSWPRILKLMDIRAQKKLGLPPGKLLELNKKYMIRARQEPKSLRVDGVGYYVWSRTAHELKLNPEDTHDLLNWWFDFLPQTIKPSPGAKDLLKTLKKKKIKNAIVSSGGFHNKFLKLKSAKLLPFIDLLLPTGFFSQDKPTPDPYRYTLNYFDFQPQDALVIGDHYEHDLTPALDLGMDVVYFESKRHGPPPPDINIPSIKKLSGLLKYI